MQLRLFSWCALALALLGASSPRICRAEDPLVTRINFRLGGRPSPFTTNSTWEAQGMRGFAFPAYRASYYVQANFSDFLATVFYEWDVPSAMPRIAGQLDIVNLIFRFGEESSASWSHYTCNPTPTLGTADARFWITNKSGFPVAEGPGDYYVPNLKAYPLPCGAEDQNRGAGNRLGPAQIDPIAVGATVEVRDGQGALLDLPGRFLSTVVEASGGFLYTDEVSNFTDSTMFYTWEMAGLAGELAPGQSVSHSFFSADAPAEYLSGASAAWPTYLDAPASFSGPSALLRPLGPLQVAVPEPSSAALLLASGAALLPLGVLRRRATRGEKGRSVR